MRQRISRIDRDKNGNITNSELEDILKLENPSLMKYNLKPALKSFSYGSNTLLINYNRFFAEAVAKQQEIVKNMKLDKRDKSEQSTLSLIKC